MKSGKIIRIILPSFHAPVADTYANSTSFPGTVTPVSSINREFEERETLDKANRMGMTYVDIEHVHINPDHLSLIPLEEAREALIMPFFRVGKKMRVALVHPTDPKTLEVIRRLKESGYSLNINLASESGLRKALENYQRLPQVFPIAPSNVIDETKIASYQKELESLSEIKETLSQVTAEEALNFIHLGATKTGTSDIHYQPEESGVRVRFRIDGVLQEVFVLPHDTYKYVSNQLKYKAGMKLNITNIPQDGRFFFVVNERKIDVRVSGIPTEFGESFVCRLLDPKQRMMSFQEMGFEGQTLQHLEAALNLPNGMILVAGPTGSGKTTTLYTLLSQFNRPENKIITLEDPIEYHLENLTQSQINEKRGYTFASGLRAILRQNPNIVMIGEIRDLDTAETAAQAALTGHILLSTLHANSSIEVVARLQNIGLPPYMIAPSLGLVVAQRLVRRVCPYCVKRRSLTPAEQSFFSERLKAMEKRLTPLPSLPATVAEPEGCEKCNHTGFLGQIAIAEAFQTDANLREKILGQAPVYDLFQGLIQQGMLTMAENGLIKVLRGETTLNEVLRVASFDMPRSFSQA